MAESSSVKAEIQKPKFKPLRPDEMSEGSVQFRVVRVPQHRFAPFKKAWLQEPRGEFDIYPLVHDTMKIDLYMNLKKRQVVLKTCPDTPDISHLQKCAEFLAAFMAGFDVKDAVALLRCDEIDLESIKTEEIKPLKGEHLNRAIGRVSGKGGKTKFAIENATHTRIVIAGTKDIHILGSHLNIKVAKDAICRLIMGSPAGKVYSKLRAVSARLAECH